MPSFTGRIADLVKDDDFVCTPSFLSSVGPDFVLPSEVPGFNWWKYEGNGTEIEKFLAIVDKNPNRSEWVVIDCGTEFIPITTTVGSEVIEAMDVETKEMSEQSQRNVRGFLLSLLYRLPKLRLFEMDHDGSPNHVLMDVWLEDIWNHFPASVKEIWIGEKVTLSGSIKKKVKDECRKRNIRLVFE